ncbi:unnamed protein product [Mytilus edulis]|uniref:MYND-type domain-containing protein n=1 Tax=Mytilus edulis TaxID=6550 RepID=A0A8S3U8T8_MYTED|nr:unnamed protein product [Mytilus edulis]
MEAVGVASACIASHKEEQARKVHTKENTQPGNSIHVHFENIKFLEGGCQILVTSNSVATFYKCSFSNGQIGCEYFPKCKGEEGCINRLKCKVDHQSSLSMSFANKSIGKVGFAGVCVSNGGTAYVDSCLFERCGGAKRLRRSVCGGNVDPLRKNELVEEGASRAVIHDNIIRQNGLSGISFDGGFYEVKGNLIHSNWLWGMMVKSRSYSYIQNNEICENKCGGIRIGHNYTAAVFIDGNTIRDHTGPDIYTVNSIYNSFGKHENITVADGEMLEESRKPFISSINVFHNNERMIQHPTDLFCSIKACCFCHKISQQLESCSKCKKAKYCSKYCQMQHWIKHKHMCKLLTKSYVVEVQMCDTEPNNLGQPPELQEAFDLNLRSFHPNLVGTREGNTPDKSSSNKFIVKIQTGREYGYYDPLKRL